MRYLTIFQRFLLVIGLLSIALAGVLVVQVGILRTTVVEERQSQVRQMVDLGKSILASYDAKVRSGSLSPDAARRDAFDAIGALRWGPYSDYFAVYGAGPDDAGVIYVDANPKYIGVNRWNFTDSDGKHLIQDIVGAARSGGGYVDYRVPRAAGGPELRKIAFVGAFGPPETALALEAGVYVDDIDEAVYQKAVWAGLCGLVGLVFTGIAALGIARSVTTPLSQIGAIMDRLAAGDFGVTISAPGKRSQISRICRSLTVFKDVLVAADQARQQQMQADRRAAEAKQAALHDMATTVEADTSAALKNIRDRAATMTDVADQMRASAVRTDQAVSLAAAAAEQSLASARSVAGAAEELAASINGVGGKMLESSAAVGRAVAAGTETRATIEALNENVSRIGDVVGIIDSIAAKTNLLALNATIEASRAGDAGKGFAVVAHEVKQLASQTAKSTAEIAAQIDQVRNSTSASVAAVQGIEQTIREINAIAGAVAAAIEQQGAATAGIARSVDESAKAAEVMTIRIGDVSIEAGKASRFSDAVQENVTGLDFAMEEMRHSVTRVARTSTGAPDRRNAVRYKVDLPAQVFYQGVSREVRLHDLSDTGARIRMKMEPQWPTHARGILCFEGFGLPFVAQSHEGGTLRVAFDLDAKTAASFHGSAERFGIGRGRVAA